MEFQLYQSEVYEKAMLLLLKQVDLFFDYYELLDGNSVEDRTYDLSMSHGLVGIMSIFCVTILKKYPLTFTVLEKIMNSISKLQKFLLDIKKDMNGFWTIDAVWNPKEYLIDREYLNLSWCYGLLGISNTLLLSSKVLSDDKSVSEVIHNLENIILQEKNRVINADIKAGFCHGSSGIIYIYSRIISFKDSFNHEFKSFLTREYCRNHIEGTGLLTGNVGLLLVILALENKQKIIGECCFLLS